MRLRCNFPVCLRASNKEYINVVNAIRTARRINNPNAIQQLAFNTGKSGTRIP